MRTQYNMCTISSYTVCVHVPCLQAVTSPLVLTLKVHKTLAFIWRGWLRKRVSFSLSKHLLKCSLMCSWEYFTLQGSTRLAKSVAKAIAKSPQSVLLYCRATLIRLILTGFFWRLWMILACLTMESPARGVVWAESYRSTVPLSPLKTFDKHAQWPGLT